MHFTQYTIFYAALLSCALGMVHKGEGESSYTYLGKSVSKSIFDEKCYNIFALQKNIAKNTDLDQNIARLAQDTELVAKAFFQKDAEALKGIGCMYAYTGNKKEAERWFRYAEKSIQINTKHKSDDLGFIKEVEQETALEIELKYRTDLVMTITHQGANQDSKKEPFSDSNRMQQASDIKKQAFDVKKQISYVKKQISYVKEQVSKFLQQKCCDIYILETFPRQGVIYTQGVSITSNEIDLRQNQFWYPRALESSYNMPFLRAKERFDNMIIRQDYKKVSSAEIFAMQVKLATEGSAISQLLLADMYYHGEGCEKDLKQAFLWYTKAVEQDDFVAKFKLGKMYYHGEGCEKDLEKAVFLIAKAENDGYHEAKIFLDTLKKAVNDGYHETKIFLNTLKKEK